MEILDSQDVIAWVDTLDRESDSFTTFRNDRNNAGSLTDDNVKGLVEDNENNLWVATALGLNRIIFEGASVKIVRQATNIPYHIECIVAGPNGELWLGTTNGLFKFKGGKTRPVEQKVLTSGTASYSIYSIHLDKRGNLWLGTSHGLVKYNTATEAYYPVASVKRNGLLPAIYGIAEDHNNKLWLAGSVIPFADMLIVWLTPGNNLWAMLIHGGTVIALWLLCYFLRRHPPVHARNLHKHPDSPRDCNGRSVYVGRDDFCLTGCLG